MAIEELVNYYAEYRIYCYNKGDKLKGIKFVYNKDKWITANYKETQIANIYIGQQVRIKVDAVPGKIFHGEVTAISEATGSKYSLVPTDNSAGNFVKVQQRIPVRIELEDVSSEEMAQLRAGMMVETEALRK